MHVCFNVAASSAVSGQFKTVALASQFAGKQPLTTLDHPSFPAVRVSHDVLRCSGDASRALDLLSLTGRLSVVNALAPSAHGASASACNTC